MRAATRIVERLIWLWRAILVVCLLQVAWWAADREPPFRLISAVTNSPEPGGVLHVTALVHRDLERDCSVTFSRYLFDAAGFRHDSIGPQLMTPYALRTMDAMAPGQLNIRMRIPEEFPPGKGTINTVLEYRCNPLQDVMRPIQVEMNIPFEVKP